MEEGEMYRSDYEALLKNSVWQEIVMTLEEVSLGLADDLKNIDPVKDPGLLARQQGRLLMAEYVLSMPVDMLREIEETANKEERKEGAT